MASVPSEMLYASQRAAAADLTRGQVFAQNCPSRAVLSHVTSRWGVLVLVALRKGTHRFGDLRRGLEGVSEKMLSQTLQALEADGFVQRTAYPVVPPHVEYDLTPLGEEAAAHVQALVDWIERNIGAILSSGAVPLDPA
ncbi:helix-turn-helix transcriptional regulator [Xanthomonas hyacinthi]|uniref:Transcriptional regulator n=1 Tax=Xanthomonas hyacinthi TaxID=56455 RepID=A0A2S7EWN3_9XANT|nr:HxlR family transcriptional regulator [Xanthomonas hyacinthi DSM 19077]PPU97563.1 transcriptional regulator [Xanthomonas hyacinthi]QGY77306.1 helix-turn-helix transcriptional regulator [Xanthomonas hyacinthi]